MRRRKRTICFITGTRAEFGLMRTTLAAIAATPSLRLQLVVTGMHLSHEHGYSIDDVRASGFEIDAVVPWQGDGASDVDPHTPGQRPGFVAGDVAERTALAVATGHAIASLATAFERIGSDIVLVVGDRVEAFAAATAAHLSGRIAAHVHGGDRAAGQVDDALRHAITKLAHVHFPATPASAERISRLGEDRWRIHRVGAPGIDGITRLATPRRSLLKKFPVASNEFALLVLHPTEARERAEAARAKLVLAATREAIPRVLIVYPNNDPGSAGIVRVWQSLKQTDTVQVERNLARGDFLALMRDASVLVGNSSSGIIEAASFGTPVIDIGPRQLGREHGGNVRHVEFDREAITRAVRSAIRETKPGGSPKNLYGGNATGKAIARVLARLIISPKLQRKLIAY